MRTGLVEDSIATTNQGGSVTYFRDSSYLSFLADSGAFVLKVSLFVFLKLLQLAVGRNLTMFHRHG